MSKKPSRWDNSNRAIEALKKATTQKKSTQVIFELGDADDHFRMAACQNGLSPSDQLRTIFGLELAKKKRPRLSLSLSDQDWNALASRYGLKVVNKIAIRKRMEQALIEHVSHLE
ncbi:MAG: hypothetical protein L3J62_04905 [Gammaproteobacteria bacterium]|nr:hypothetical protein [Gammaproteobacteria bacterium]MCF6230125.1 hypothetical protein [Gammaproteobacteria bacterium]